MIIANQRPEPASSHFIVTDYQLRKYLLSSEKRLQPCSAKKAEWKEDGIEIITDESKWNAQLKSEPIVLDPCTRFELPFTIDLKQGGVFIGLLAPDESHYLVYKTCHTPGLFQDTLRLPFGTPEKSTCLIIANQRPEPKISYFTVKEYTLKRISYAQLYKLQNNAINSSLVSQRADISFEVQKLDNNHLYFTGRENGKIILDQTFLPSTLEDVFQGSFHLKRQDNIILWTYNGQDGSRMVLVVTDEGDIKLVPARAQTGYQAHKSWGFRTTGNIINQADSCFYSLYLHATQIHNFGLLKCFEIDSQQSYFFNKGIIHLGDDTGEAALEIYPEYLPFIDKDAEPHYQENTIDDHGVTLAERGLKIGHMTHRVHRFADVEQLELEQAPLEVFQQMTVAGSIIGSTPSLINHGSIGAGSITSSFAIQDWTNRGEVRLSAPSEIVARNSFDNSGVIRSQGSFTLNSSKKPKSLGMIISDEEIKAMIDEILTPEERALVFGQARFLSKKRRLVIDMVHHTDHYLNKITNHYVQEKRGQRFTGKTETGYVFQHRTSERSQKVIEEAALDIPEEIEGLDRAYHDRQQLLLKLKSDLKDRIRALLRFYDAVSGAQDISKMLASVLGDMGLEGDEVKDIVEDPGLQSLLMALNLPEDRASIFVDLLEDPQRLLYHSLTAMVQELQTTAIQWIMKNLDSFINLVCGGASIVNLLDKIIPFSPTKHPYAQLGLQGVNAFCGIRGAQRSLPKIQAHFRKQHEAKGTTPAASSSSSGSTDTSTGFSGRSGFEIKNFKQQPSRNKPTSIDEISYSGHALDQMQNRGIPPTVVKNAIKNGTSFETHPGTVGFHDSSNNIMVIMNPENNIVITVIRGKP